jgi:lysophospholipase L1-like esterase
LYRLNEITSSKPKKIFLLIDVNDVRYKRSVDYIIGKNHQIVEIIKKESPKTKIYLQSILPTYARKERPIDTIRAINQGLEKIAQQENIIYIDLFSHFIDSTGYLDKKYSLDGLHLNGVGYQNWKDVIKHLVR